IATAVAGVPAAQVLARSAEGERDRRRPGVAGVGRGGNFPYGAAVWRVVMDVAELRGAVTEEDPGASRFGNLHVGKLVVLGHVVGERPVEVGGGLLPGAACMHCQPDGSRLVEPRRFFVHQEAGVLAPVEAALVPGGPKASLLVAGEGHVRFK